MQVYLDSAASTALSPEVLEAMMPYMTGNCGNPSAVHAYGRQTRAAIEKARKTVADILNASTGEIFFTSGGTEANNTAIKCSIIDLGIRHIISSPLEHHCVSHSVERMVKNYGVEYHEVEVDSQGHVKLDSLKRILSEIDGQALVTLMHANNEIGTLLDMKAVGEICKEYNAIFHSDTVQTVGHYRIDLQDVHVHFISGSGHKFHGPKGTGMLYINSELSINPYIDGGSQERNMRAGTENVPGIVGFGEAMRIAYDELDEVATKLSELKQYMKSQLESEFPDIGFNGDVDGGLYTVLNVSFPPSNRNEMLLFNLDIQGIAASGGSACTSGSDVGSHVLQGIGADPKRKGIRFSFSKYTTKAEIDYTLAKLKEMIPIAV